MQKMTCELTREIYLLSDNEADFHQQHAGPRGIVQSAVITA